MRYSVREPKLGSVAPDPGNEGGNLEIPDNRHPLQKVACLLSHARPCFPTPQRLKELGEGVIVKNENMASEFPLQIPAATYQFLPPYTCALAQSEPR
ncbi:hypothetical protein pRL100332 (plasmid) [Rhizobium johnstonii 3841]|uniref:Uncharacterized protein n=1 Tax=Rhizobium johnstonii (strain DSM 114642 / LMG 32736 / 3841) TaxID=216596 RepID=Q1M7H4_RHIJ3|nr:hypothetical protein pRL100332 [Rhizobium johnstonii 3841]